jgi:hypothetical protein
VKRRFTMANNKKYVLKKEMAKKSARRNKAKADELFDWECSDTVEECGCTIDACGCEATCMCC